MRGVADEHHAGAVPFLDRHPVDRPAMDLLVARQRGEIVLDDAAETGEATAQAVEPARHWLMAAQLGDVAEAIGAPVTYRAEPEEAILASRNWRLVRTRGRIGATLRHAMAPV